MFGYDVSILCLGMVWVSYVWVWCKHLMFGYVWASYVWLWCEHLMFGYGVSILCLGMVWASYVWVWCIIANVRYLHYRRQNNAPYSDIHLHVLHTRQRYNSLGYLFLEIQIVHSIYNGPWYQIYGWLSKLGPKLNTPLFNTCVLLIWSSSFWCVVQFSLN